MVCNSKMRNNSSSSLPSETPSLFNCLKNKPITKRSCLVYLFVCVPFNALSDRQFVSSILNDSECELVN